MLQTIYQNGRVDYTIGDFNLFSVDVNTLDPNKALVSIPLKMERYSEEDVRKIYDFRFKTFVDEVVNEEIATDGVETNEELEGVIEELRNENELSEAERKNLIISLRIQLEQGNVSDDFKPVFPYEPINQILPEDIIIPFDPVTDGPVGF